MILQHPPASRLTWIGGLALVGLAALALPWRPTWADDPKANQPPIVRSTDSVESANPAEPKPAVKNDRVTNASMPVSPEQVRQHEADAASRRDEIELLQAQTATKQAQLQIAEAGIEAARVRSNAVKGGNVSVIEKADAESAVMLAQGQIRLRQAELQEHLLRVKQAQRRLDELNKQWYQRAASHVRHHVAMEGPGQTGLEYHNPTDRPWRVSAVRSSDPNVKVEIPKEIPARGSAVLVMAPDWDKIERRKKVDIWVELADPPVVAWQVALDIVPPPASPKKSNDEQNRKRIESLQIELDQLRKDLKVHSFSDSPPAAAPKKSIDEQILERIDTLEKELNELRKELKPPAKRWPPTIDESSKNPTRP